MNRALLAAATCVLLTASAFAEEADADTRFHRAYEQEVVEGKVADAARVYLAMMDDAKVPERLRTEAKFRFAVTAVLLGRADEGRAHLAEIVRDPRTPETLRSRASEYLDAVKGIGVGNELDKKMQALVFDLGRADPNKSDEVPACYRDFQIIGRPAVPFLRRLLDHTDLALRQHAYRILLGMKDPGLGAAWKPELTSPYPTRQRLAAYLKALPAEQADFEKQVLAADDDALARYLYTPVPMSAEFLRAAAARNAPPAALVAGAVGGRNAECERILLEWANSDKPELASAAALGVVRSVSWHPKEWTPDPALFAATVARLLDTDIAWTPTAYQRGKSNNPERESYDGFQRIAAGVQVAELARAMEGAIERIGKAPDEAAARRAFIVADAVAWAFHARELPPEEAARYAAALRSWAGQLRATRRDDFGDAMSAHVSFVLRRLPPAEAERLAVWLVTEGLRTQIQYRAAAVPVDGPEDVPVVLAAWRAADPNTRSELLVRLGLVGDPQPGVPDAEYARAVLAVLPELTRGAAEAGTRLPLATFARLALLLPVEQARERLVAVAAAAARSNDRTKGIETLLATTRVGEGVDVVRYHAEIVVPSLEALHRAAPDGSYARPLVEGAVLLLSSSGPAPETANAIRDFILAHLDAVPSHCVSALANRPELFPLAIWVPGVPDEALLNPKFKVAPDAAAAAVKEMLADPAKVTAGILKFTQTQCDPEFITETFDRLLRTAPLDDLPLVLWAMNYASGSPANPTAVEDALARVVAAEKPDLEVLKRLVLVLQTVRPSEKLIPAVPLLLAGDQAQRLAGIDAAACVGREEMLPLIRPLLDSMDAVVRKKASDTYEAIVEAKRRRAERSDSPK